MINKISLNHLCNLAFLSVVSAVLLAGCGGGGGGGGGGDASTGTGPAATVPDPMYKQQILGSIQTNGSYAVTCREEGAQNTDRVLQISRDEISLTGKKTFSANTDDAYVDLERLFEPRRGSNFFGLTLTALNKSISFKATFTPSGKNEFIAKGFEYYDKNTAVNTTCVPNTTAAISYLSTSLPKQLFTNETGSISCTKDAIGPALYDYALTSESLTLSSGQDRVVFNLGERKAAETFGAQNVINSAGMPIGDFTYNSGIGNQYFSILKYADSGVSEIFLKLDPGSIINCRKMIAVI